MPYIHKSVDEQLKVTKFYSFFTKKFDCGYSFSGETHDFWECVYIMDNSAIISADDKVYILNAGDLIFHKPMELHKINIESEKGTTILIFSYEMTGNIASFFEGKVFSLTHIQRNIIDFMVKYAQKHYDSVDKSKHAEYLQYLTPFETTPTYSQVTQTYVHMLFLSLLESGKLADAKSDKDTDIFEKAVGFMKNNITSSLSVSGIANELNISESMLKRIFNKYAGIGIHKYFLTLKIQEAVYMLDDGMTVTEVSDELNFSSQGYFSRAFKREKGLSPTEYTKRNLIK